jgi:hypothetical protein
MQDYPFAIALAAGGVGRFGFQAKRPAPLEAGPFAASMLNTRGGHGGRQRRRQYAMAARLERPERTLKAL